MLPCRRALRAMERLTMTVCPIAIAVGCKKCPAFSICPLKGVLGDQPKKDEAPRAANDDAPKRKTK
jgi:hypothetical protein